MHNVSIYEDNIFSEPAFGHMSLTSDPQNS